MNWQWFDLAYKICLGDYVLYLNLASFMYSKPWWRTTALQICRVTLKWICFPLPLLTFIDATHNGTFRFTTIILMAIQAICWWLTRNVGDDDDWRNKLADRVKEKVEAVEGRLVIVPVGAPA